MLADGSLWRIRELKSWWASGRHVEPLPRHTEESWIPQNSGGSRCCLGEQNSKLPVTPGGDGASSTAQHRAQ